MNMHTFLTPHELKYSFLGMKGLPYYSIKRRPQINAAFREELLINTALEYTPHYDVAFIRIID